MIDYLARIIKKTFRGGFVPGLLQKIRMNGIAANADLKHCKRSYDDENVDGPNKKLCTVSNEQNQNEEKICPKRLKKHKFVLLLSYNGHDYYGMQINKDVITIEKVLFQSLLKSGLISETDIENPKQIEFQRAARTDKTVSAVRQIVSLSLPRTFSIQDINSHLPPDVRVFSSKRVTKRFNSKNFCSYRRYSYVLPTYVMSQEPLDKFLEVDYRIPPELLNNVRNTLEFFVGTHNFHNFTVKIDYEDPRASRYIIDFKCSDPFVRGKEFVIFTVKGQSFMMHQIRKMVSVILAVARGIVDENDIPKFFLKDKRMVPKAPGLGLFLEEAHFDGYNRKYGSDGTHDKLEWNDIEEELSRFREEKIVTPIIKSELENQEIITWMKEKFYNSEYKFFQIYDENEEVKDQEEKDGEEEGEQPSAICAQ
ncbi:UNVERIFIED_CONTAM: hypothetical protein PYX00_007116 [Menopon gallinae]|uniref:Pseudouridylate synthase 1 homolog n=1 Tax=Menopon gallinae TaxID=328185 RepID=A0AAW2HI17_9NEOP